MKLEDLKKTMEYKTRRGANGMDLAYIDARQVMDRLDDVCGTENWQCKYEEVKGHIYCHIGIKCENEWVWKSDCGVESNFDAEKGEASDAFKRAAVRWGIGRFLYDIKLPKEKSTPYNQQLKDKSKPTDKQKDFLIRKGHWSEGMTQAEASKLIGELM